MLISSTGGIAVAAAPPQPLNVPADAKTISSYERPAGDRVGSAVNAKWSGTKVRQLGGNDSWRGKGASAQVRSAGTVRFANESARVTDASSSVSRFASLGSLVRPASESAPIDPLEDPFGDKRKASQGSSIAASGGPAIESGSPPKAQPAFPLPATPPAFPSLSPPAVPNTDGPAGSALKPEAESPSLRGSEIPRSPLPFQSGPAHTRFNGRDCSDELHGCQAHRDFLKSSPLQNISLDITPSHTLSKLPQNRTQLDESLSRIPSRVFHGRRGDVLAEGRLIEYRHGRIAVQDANGETQDVPFADLSDEDICFVTAWWNIPTECTLADSDYEGRHWEELTLTWKATAVCHKPLYFEEVQLERYGHSAGPFVQPLLSGAHFFLNIAALPYNMGIHPPNECRYPLGYYRPGDCAPWLVPPVPLSVRGGLLAAGVYLGGIYVIP